MKKIISLFLVVLMIVTATFTTAFADSGKKNSGRHIPYGIAKKLFNDSDEVKWAQKAIEKLKSKGFVKGWEGYFLPKTPVTKIEAVVMALRIMGWEDEALAQKRLPMAYRGADVQQWAVGYVAVAYDKGILDDVDMMYFKPQEPAKRHEVAKFVIRALGKEDEAEDHMDEDLSFTDASAIPQGSVGYFYMVNELGIMKGDGKNFNPMGTLTRAEMAVLFNNLDEKVDSDKDENEYTGTLQDIEDDELVLKVGNVNKTFDVSEDAVVYDKGDRIDYADLDEGDYVTVQLENNEVVYIEITDANAGSSKIIYRYQGEVSKVTDDPATITVKVLTMTVTFEVPSTAGVYFKGVKGTFDEIKEDDSVTVTVDDRNRAVRINVDRQNTVTGEAKGTIDQLGSDWIKVLVNGVVKEYDYASDMSIDIKGRPDNLTSLEKGMKVELQLKDGDVSSLYAEDNTFTTEGSIKVISVASGKYKLTLEADDKDYTYDVSPDAEIFVDGAAKSIGTLDEGMEGEFEIINAVIYKIEVDN